MPYHSMDHGGLVFEETEAETLAEALAAVEQGLKKGFEQEGIED